MKKNCNIDYSSSLPYLTDVNWLYISCKVTKTSSKSSKQDDCYLVLLEAVVKRCSVKKLFLEILQNSQENDCARISFLIKLQA